MKEPIGYNDNQFDDLPNEDQSWEKMSRMLDGEDKRRRVIPFWLRFSVLGVLLVGLGVAGWMMFSGNDPSKLEHANKEVITGIKKSVTAEQPIDNSKDPANIIIENRNTDPTNGQDDISSVPIDGNRLNNRIISSKENVSKGTVPVTDNSDPTSTNNNISKKSNKVNSKDRPTTSRKQVSMKPVPVTVAVTSADKNNSADKKDPVASKDNSENKSDIDTLTGSNMLLPISAAQKTPSPSSLIPDSPAQKTEVISLADTVKQKEAVAETKEKARKRRSLQWSMGVTFQQPLALGSQGMSGYNYKGNKNFIADHLPGIYVTAGKSKWFAGAEFNYGVPQPVKQVYFSQASKYDASNGTLKVERFSVEKMYYHQFSLSGNYLILRRLSAGVGGTYNLLTGAVTERELRSSNVITGETQTQNSLAPVKGYKDSFLFKSTAAAFFQSEYHWKRVKLGLRYTYALQPYMRYTKPDGNIEDVNNNTLQLLLRFQLWRK